MNIARRLLAIVCFMALMGVIYATGAYVLPDYDSLTTPPPPPPVYMPPDDIDPVYTELGPPAVIEYGSIAVINNNNDPLHAYVRYPVAGNPADDFIYKWAFDLFNEMFIRYNTGADFSTAQFGELNVQFDSYLIDNRYAGIHQFGEYSNDTLEQPHEILKTFNIDLTGFRLLEPGDILDLENPEAVLSLLSLRLLVEHPKTDGYHVFMDESWLSYLLITHDGIIVFLPHDEFLPDSFPSLTVTLPYDDLGSSLLIRRDAPLPTMPTPTPEATPTPEPDPDEVDEESEDDGTRETDAESDAGGDESDSDTADDDTDTSEDADETDSDTSEEDADTEDEPEEEPPPSVPPQGWYVDADKPTVALTFDDGPGEHLDELLNLLEQYGARATFFTVGNLVHTRSEALGRAVNLDCEVAGHSWNHKNLAKMSADDVRLQLETTNAAIESITGATPTFFRPTYGAVSDTLKEVSEELGMAMINWNLDSEDWKGKTSDEIYELVIEQVSDRAIILCHDVYEETLDAYERIIPELLIQGYQIVTVSELMRVSPSGKPVPGQVYISGHKVEQIG